MGYRYVLVTAMLISYLVLQYPATASTTDEIQWLTPSEFTLYWGEQIKIGDYTVTAQDFSASKPVDLPDDYVILNIKSNTSRSWSAILALNHTTIPNETILDGLIKLTAINVVTGNNIPTPYATIEIALAKNSSVSKPIPWINSVLKVKRLPVQEAYIDEKVYIVSEVINLKDITLYNVHVNETIPEGFILDPDIEQTCWTFTLQPKSNRLCSYSIRALKPGTFVIPGMKLSIEHNGIIHSLQTNSSNIVIHGPYIEVNKSFSYHERGSESLLNITLLVNNTGDRAAYVQLRDQLPHKSKVISGNFTRSQVMHPGDVWVLEYSLLLNNSEYILIPGAKVTFIDSKKYSDSFETPAYIFNIEENYAEDKSTEEDLLYENTLSKTEDEKLENNDDKRKESQNIYSIKALKQSLISLIERAIGWRR